MTTFSSTNLRVFVYLFSMLHAVRTDDGINGQACFLAEVCNNQNIDSEVAP